ncbi:hypothetical protein [Roseivirga thermotolerans]|jgi:hypothetical protein|uniref:DUF4890 domain-containing protein n=1 Tax=Roseivirga thermotolerans TaxID=1758176 RepID=A0ABQ3I882_9BACT|nr:hypothetical protein [Roseivirga thermotolerans]GHE63563.1 hypothetical protein GCM10011340_18660 [Roseivirga thermotolerans]
MRKLSLLFTMLVAFGLTAAYAQGGGGGQRGGQRGQGGQGGGRMSPETVAKERAQDWQEKFGLSDEQYKKTYDVLLENQNTMREKMRELMASGDREGMRSAMEENQKALDKKLKEIFTEAQWTKYEAWKKENPPMQRRGGSRD